MSKKKERDDEKAKARGSGGDVQSKGLAVIVAEEFERDLSDETELVEEINAKLRVIEELRAETRGHDEEMARLGEETRRLIAELQKELKVA